ncbi:helix-turn-helix domain-containing protein [Patulibacter brassicae]|uniref:Helix-turn-helix domain-containing protein n=1 Tax=Patulibacter brassicae TaxID=1705717 RepID=A0ABU4VSA4_9ACTN|nr:helix-turn-helix domain-containing protein [Patulibacter brassicae]MDX8153783.1 helix-turn-helix domain-containing protein [Patulibacter brassicae]
MSPRPRQPRRSTTAVRESLLEAAAVEFDEHGYADTTMRAVAERAQTSLSVLHRHYPTKPRLFAAALLVPFIGFLEDFAAVWREQDGSPWDDERLMARLITELHGHLAAHRRTLEGLIAAQAGASGELVTEFRLALADFMRRLDEIGLHEAERRQWFTPDGARITERLVLAMTIGVVLTRDWLPGTDGPGPDDEAVVLERMVQFALHGITLGAGRPASAA